MAQEAEQQFVFNGVSADGDYLQRPLTPEEVVKLARGIDPDATQKEAQALHEEKQQPDFLPMAGIDPQSLEQSGWGVVFAKDADPAVREALQPLLELRKQQAGDLYREFFGEAKPYLPGESKTKFLKNRKAPTSGPVNPAKMPYYLMLVGSPDAIPAEVQSQLALQYAVGRLDLPSPKEYDNYARRVVAAETGELTVAPNLGLWGPKNPNDRATALSSEGLIKGLHEYVTRELQPLDEFKGWSIDVRAQEQATKAELAKVLGGADTPAVLFTASHGVGFRRGDERQRPHQGALLCQDWKGPRTGKLTPDLYFAGEDLSDGADLGGLIAFFFACYGGGMPQYDAFAHGRGERKQIADGPFFAALPTRMLGHPRGALATVGHIERAWGSSFYEPGLGHQNAVFTSFMRGMLGGHRLGYAMDWFATRYGELSADLLYKLGELEWDEDKYSPIEIASEWTATNDARNYIVLGDPAVRVPLAGVGQAPTRPLVEVTTASPSPAPAAEAAPAEAIPADEGNTDFGLFSRSRDDDEDESDKSSMRGSLKAFVDKLGSTISSALDDMTSLEVRTYVADDLANVSVKDGQLHGARLRGYTKVSFDGDTVVCVPERDGEIDTAAFDIHTKTVAQAQQARAELIKTFVDAAANLVGLGK